MKKTVQRISKCKVFWGMLALVFVLGLSLIHIYHQRRQAYLRQIPYPVLRTKEKKGAAWARRLGIST